MADRLPNNDTTTDRTDHYKHAPEVSHAPTPTQSTFATPAAIANSNTNF